MLHSATGRAVLALFRLTPDKISAQTWSSRALDMLIEIVKLVYSLTAVQQNSATEATCVV